MNDAQQREAAKKFAEKWKDAKGYEKGETQSFWNALLRDVYGAQHPEEIIEYELQVKDDTTNFIDGYIGSTRVVIEQKGSDVELTKKYKQSDGSFLTPYQQALKYSALLGSDRYPRWIVLCNFHEFHLHDMRQPSAKPKYVIQLSEFEKDYRLMNFLIKFETEELQRQKSVSIAAGKLVGELYDALAKQYDNPTSPESMRSLNILCVRLVFCLYAEDAGIFGSSDMFRSYLRSYPVRDMRKALKELFDVLDLKKDERKEREEYKYLARENPLLDAFPYVDGGLFDEKNVDIPPFSEEIRDLLLNEVSGQWRWRDISPTIFGAVFESTLNPVTRRSGGMHYTSIENIHKVIDPLFLDELRAESEEILALPNPKKGISAEKRKKLQKFQSKLANLSFLDPACGSGNFLTETYLSLRSIENQIIAELRRGQITFVDAEVYNPIQVKISQFYGLEINDFAVAVARTALWIAESQMMQKTEEIVKIPLDFLPLRTSANIYERNALTQDWTDVLPSGKQNYIIGNPPFVGYSLQTEEQKNDLLSVFVDEAGKPYKAAGKIDYVAGWYFMASKMMQGTKTRAAFVSTNSVTQGEQVVSVWKPLFERFKIHIDFAHRTFKWESRMTEKAQVFCVVVGFSVALNDKPKVIYDGEIVTEAENINAYLTDARKLFIGSRTESLCDVPQMITGNRPADGGHLIIEKKDYAEFVKKEPRAVPFIKRLMGSEEFIKNKDRWCLWLKDVSPAELRKMPEVMKRVEACRQDRLNSPDAGRRKLAETPTVFRETFIPEGNYVVIPEISSQRRRYIPMGFSNDSIVYTNRLKLIPNATLYHFGVLTSNVHMAWMRAVCGRFGMGYDYSINIVYNNFPWPDPASKQREKIEMTAQAILDARAKFPDSSLADLYDETVMPQQLRRAHQENDRAVMEAYGFSVREMNEATCVAELMKLYAEKTKSEETEAKK